MVYRSANDSVTILALPGSLRRGSFNRMLLSAADGCAPAGVEVRLFDDAASIPLFNEDVEAASGHGPAPVRRLRHAVAAADGLLISTPEYNQSLPGVVKNMLDWLSRPGPEEVLAGKPVAVVGATSGPWGTRLAQSALRQVLYACEALVLPAPALFVRDAGRLFDAAGELTDPPTREKLAAVLAGFTDWIRRVDITMPYDEPVESMARSEL